METILLCRICKRKIKTDDDTDYEEFTEHLTEYHFPELVEAYSDGVEDATKSGALT